MKFPTVPALALLAGLCSTPSPAAAQGPISPASPSNTAGNLFSRPPAAVAPPSAPAAARSPFDGLAGAYPPAQPVYSSTEPIDPNHKLHPGDQLSYQVAEDREPDKTATLPVLDSGEVNVPLIGRVKASGKSTGQLSADIKSALEREYYYHATVLLGLNTVARVSPGQVYVTGAVRQVGSVELLPGVPMTASQAIYKQGGPVDFSSLKRTRVMRKGGPAKGIPVDVKAVESGDLDKDVVLQPGDTIIVPEARFGLKF